MGSRVSWRRGDPYVWLAGSGLAVCLLMIAGLLGVILVNGLGVFWPGRLDRLTLQNGQVILGEILAREEATAAGAPVRPVAFRVQVKAGNRDLLGPDYRWVDEADLVSRERPLDAFYVERRARGPLVGVPVALMVDGRVVAEGPDQVWAAIPPLVARAAGDRRAIRRTEHEIGEIHARIARARLELRRLEAPGPAMAAAESAPARQAIGRQVTAEERRFEEAAAALEQLRTRASSAVIGIAIADGQVAQLPVVDVFRIYPANRLGWCGRAGVYASRLWEFVSGDPRESNTEGGIFPAIFGTVLMVVLMSLAAVPFGVLAALYLREYARQGPLVRTVRVAVNNLAGVPSIVFGMFGLGFFVYFVGGGLDRWLFAESLPVPTFGTGGILWASLTLALLTVPVVIVAAEEALASVPRTMREASLATGATKFQTVARVVLPAAAPGIMTGLILAMARGAGEVAPLMITGVVSLAPDLPLDGAFPYLHLDRKFMHLGFHAYDAGFLSANVEAARPMVFATTILLVLVVALLNVTAILIRNRLRRRYPTEAA